MSIVYTGGTFDLLHAGHIDLLRACRYIAGEFKPHNNRVIVALNRDAFVAKFKGKFPVCSYEERKKVLEACRYVDEVIENIGDADSKATIETVSPDFIVIGDDWAVKDYCKQMMFTPEWLYSHKIQLLYVARQRQLSSTEIKERTHGQLGSSTVSAE